MFSRPFVSVLFSLIIAVVCFLLNLVYPTVFIFPLFATIFALIPYYISIIEALRKWQLDLSLPPIITIYLLLYLGKDNVALVFILIILFGHLFKTIILERVKASIAKISEKLPKTARVKVDDKETMIEIKDIKISDILAVKSGERVATDAFLLADEAMIDESVVTGESKPVVKKKGDKLLAGSINAGDYFEAAAAATAANSTLLQIQHLVFQAQNDKAPLAHVVSKYAWVTTLCAFVGVVVIFILTHDIIKALSFWIAVVPVIFAIIVPVATTIGITILAKSGILIKSSPALENLTKANTFLFDKTGTITQGKPEVEDILVVKGDKTTILQLTASLEKYSSHPLSIPILYEANKQKLELIPLQNVKTIIGKGMVASNKGRELVIGNDTLLKDQNIEVNPKVLVKISEWERKGATPVFVGEDKEFLGVVFLLDKLRSETPALFSTLARNSYETIIVTGDKQEVAQSIAQKLQGASFIADVRPEGKVDEVDKKVRAGRNVIMVGDGINDAPALAKANVGIAMGGNGVDLTLNAADIVLLNNNIGTLPQMIKVSKKTFRIIKQDVLLATLIHLITAMLVIVGSINLVETALVHEVSSVLVLLNTIRLFRIKIKV